MTQYLVQTAYEGFKVQAPKKKNTALQDRRKILSGETAAKQIGCVAGRQKSSWGINPRHSVLFYKIGGICDKGYHGSQGTSRWFCKIYCGKAVIVGLMYGICYLDRNSFEKLR